MEGFESYLQETVKDSANAEYCPSNLQHSLGVPSETMTALNEVISPKLIGPYSVDTVTQGFPGTVSSRAPRNVELLSASAPRDHSRPG